MSADHVSLDGAEAPDVVAQYAEWFSVAGPVDGEQYPKLVLGTDSHELHLELDPERCDELLADLVAQLPAEESEGEDTDGRGREALPKRFGSKVVAASGWSSTSRWWRGANANTRIVVYGVIAAFVAFGLLVTF